MRGQPLGAVAAGEHTYIGDSGIAQHVELAGKAGAVAAAAVGGQYGGIPHVNAGIARQYAVAYGKAARVGPYKISCGRLRVAAAGADAHSGSGYHYWQ